MMDPKEANAKRSSRFGMPELGYSALRRQTDVSTFQDVGDLDAVDPGVRCSHYPRFVCLVCGWVQS